jgi:glutamate formiminotransferase / formiminotetrahydrofolate cyclodeaminase
MKRHRKVWLGANKPGWEDRLEEFSDWAVKAQSIKDKLLFYVDEDTRAFNGIIDGIRMPKDTAEEKAARSAAIESASVYATEIPKKVMETAFLAYPCIEAMITRGNKSSVTDAGVGALCIDLAIQGAGMNVLVNAKDLSDSTVGDSFKTDALNLMVQSNNEAARLRAMVLEVLNS